MSLKASPMQPIPELTERIARSAFPRREKQRERFAPGHGTPGPATPLSSNADMGPGEVGVAAQRSRSAN